MDSVILNNKLCAHFSQTISTSRQPLTLGFPQLRDKSETRSRDKPDTLHTDQGDRNSNSANAGAATVVINTDPLWGHQQPLPPVSHRDSLISSAHVAPSISTPKPSASNKPLVAVCFISLWLFVCVRFVVVFFRTFH